MENSKSKDSILDMVNGHFKEKMESPFWGTFIFSWLLYNWKIWYITFFIDSELLFKSKRMLKIDYIYSFYSNNIWNIFELVILPSASTYIIIYLFSKITIAFHKKRYESKCEIERDRLEKGKDNLIRKIQIDKDLSKEKQEKTKAEKEFLKEEQKKSKLEDEIKSNKPEILWEEEYSTFRKNRLFKKFPLIIDSLYGGNGWVDEISSDIVSYVHVLGLIEFIDSNRNRIKETEKGKYFIKLYNESLF